MRDLFKALTTCEVPFYNPIVITRLEWTSLHDSNELQRDILQQSSRLISVQLVNHEGTLIVQMMKHQSQTSQLDRKEYIRKVTDDTHRMGTFIEKQMVITKDEIIDFVHDVGDTNPIHRQVPYIVPGCLILERLHKALPTVRRWKLRFYHALCAGEPFLIRGRASSMIGSVGPRKIVAIDYTS